MTRILWHSAAPHAQTGYGQQTALFVPRLRGLGHDMAVSATWGQQGAAQLSENDIPVYPADDQWGHANLPLYAEHHKADLVIALMDAWVLNPELTKVLPPFAVWVPVDHDPVPPLVAKFFKTSGARAVAMSRFGEARLNDEGLDALYVPHGVDTTVFTPAARESTREMLGWADTDFGVGIVANNAGGGGLKGTVPRKAFPQSLMAFAALKQRHPEAKLYLHTEMSGKQQFGVNVWAMVERFGIPPECVKVTDRTMMEIGINPATMAAIYSAFDVLLMPSYGEGFGVPLIEAQACGTPVITTDWTAMPELVGAGWKLEGDKWYDPQHDSFFMYVNESVIVEALEEAFESRGDTGLRASARAFAVGYDADLITDTYWKPALEELARPREVPPLPNREMRRAKRKQAA